MFMLAICLLNVLLWLTKIELTYGFPKILKYILSSGILGLVAYHGLVHRRDSKRSRHPAVVKWFIVYSIVMLVLSFRADQFYWQQFLVSRYFAVPYLLPLLILMSRFDVQFFRTAVALSRRLLPFSMGILAYALTHSMTSVTWTDIGYGIKLFDIFSLLLLLTCHLSARRSHRFVAIGYHVMLLYSLAYYGRRGSFLLIGMSLLAMLWLRIKSKSFSPAWKFGIILITLALVLAGNAYREQLSGLKVFTRGMSTEGFQDSRGTVVSDFFSDFGGMQDYLFGRGINGTIKRTIRGGELGTTIENGYLNVLLRGGLLYLAPMLLIFAYSACLGYFKSNNDLSKALALIVALQFISMMAFGLPSYTTEYILLWIAVSAGFNKQLRVLNNRDLYLYSNFSTFRKGQLLS